MSERLLVLYHGGCTDGAVAAWAVRLAHADVECVPVAYQSPPPDVSGRDVVVVDFSYPRDVLLDMHARAKSLKVLDHHKTAAEDLAGLPFCVFDMNRSGAGLAWDEFHGKPRPWIVDYVEDRDLWRWALPHSKPVNAYLQTIGFELDMVEAVYALGLTQALEHGRVAEAVRRDYIEAVKRGAYAARIEGEPVDCFAVNAAGWAGSELIGELAEGSLAGYALGYVELADGRYAYSLRARGGGPDVSAIAKRFGGGGHAAAAGFRVERLVHHRTAY